MIQSIDHRTVRKVEGKKRTTTANDKTRRVRNTRKVHLWLSHVFADASSFMDQSISESAVRSSNNHGHDRSQWESKLPDIPNSRNAALCSCSNQTLSGAVSQRKQTCEHSRRIAETAFGPLTVRLSPFRKRKISSGQGSRYLLVTSAERGRGTPETARLRKY